MEEKDIELLLKEFSTRLHYGLKIQCVGWDSDHGCEFTTVEELFGIDDKFIYTLWRGERDMHSIQEPSSVLYYKPYLRPMASMTEEEVIEFNNIPSTKNYQIVNGDLPWDVANYKQIDWLNAHHFDYCGLIPKGLAIEVTESNNPYKIKDYDTIH